MQVLNSYQDIASIPDKYCYTSPMRKARYFWTLIFGFLTGDLNPIHINPFTTTNFKSRLGGLARHGISTLAQAESFIFKIFKFKESTEIIAKGYNNIRYLSPVNMGDRITYIYTLLHKKVSEEKKYAECKWQIEGINQKNKKVFTAEWVIIYSPVEKNLITTHISPIPFLTNPMEVQDTPTNIWLLRLWILFCVGIICFMIYLNRNT